MDDILTTGRQVAESLNALNTISPASVLTDGARLWQDALSHMNHFLRVDVPNTPAPASRQAAADVYKEVLKDVKAIGALSFTYSPTAVASGGEDYTVHVRALQEAAGALGFGQQLSAADMIQCVDEASESTQFYLNKVLTATRTRDSAATHKHFVSTVQAHLKALRAAVPVLCGGSSARETLPWCHTAASAAASATPPTPAPTLGDSLDDVRTAFNKLVELTSQVEEYTYAVKDSAKRVREILHQQNNIVRYARHHARPLDANSTLLGPVQLSIRDALQFISRSMDDRQNAGSRAALALLAHVAVIFNWVFEPAGQSLDEPFLEPAQRSLDAAGARVAAERTQPMSALSAVATQAGGTLIRYVRTQHAQGLQFAKGAEGGDGRPVTSRRLRHPPDVTRGDMEAVLEAAESADNEPLLSLTRSLASVVDAYTETLEEIRETSAAPTTVEQAQTIFSALDDAIDEHTDRCRQVAKTNAEMRPVAQCLSNAANLFTWVSSVNAGLYARERFADSEFDLNRIVAHCHISISALSRAGSFTNSAAAGGGGGDDNDAGTTAEHTLRYQAAQSTLNWARQLREVLQKIMLFVALRYPQGAPWGENGKTSPAGDTASGTPPPTLQRRLSGPVRGAGGPPPPPPPPPAASRAVNAPSSSSGGTQALFDEINQQGLDITKRLRHVSKEEKQANAAPSRAATAVPSHKATRQGPAWPPQGEPVIARDAGRKRWTVAYVRPDDNHAGDDDGPRVVELPESELDTQHTLLVQRCYRVYIKVPAKVNTVQIVECVQVQLELQDTVGPVELTSCEEVEMLVHGVVPSIQLDKVRTGTIHLADAPVASGRDENPFSNTDIVTSCCTNVNITVPVVDEDGDVVRAELPVPEQFVSQVTTRDTVKTTQMQNVGE